MRKFWLVFSFLAAALLAACGGDSGSKAATSDEIVAESMEDLPNCTKNREGLRAVTGDGDFVCVDGIWEEESPEIPSFETEEDLPNCTNKKEGMVAYVEDLEDTLVCKSGEWQENGGFDGESSSGSEIDYDISVETVDDVPACTEKRRGVIVYVEESGTLKKCESGLWEDYEPGEDPSSSVESSADDAESSSSIESSAESEDSSSSESIRPSSSSSSVYDADDNTLTDYRDGRVYNTVVIGGQTWMAENLDYASTSSMCYDGDPLNCEIYGRLYQQRDALNACPYGWRLPTREEASALLQNSVSSLLASGTNTTGFSALLGGSSNGYMDVYAIMWISEEDIDIRLSKTDAGIYRTSSSEYVSVRCLKD